MLSKTDLRDAIAQRLSRPAKWWAKMTCYESGESMFERMSAFMLKDGINGDHKRNGSAYLHASIQVIIEAVTEFYLVIFSLIMLIALPLSFWLGMLFAGGGS